MLKPNLHYSRKNSIVYHEGVPLVTFDSYFPDFDRLSVTGIEYLNKYMSMYPDKFKILDKVEDKIIKIFYDVETTGVNYRQHGIHQLSGLVEINGEVKEKFNWYVKPNPKAKIDPEALAISGITEDDFDMYPDMGEVFKEFKKILDRYINRFDKTEKAWLVGYNSREFDDDFLRAWFDQNGDTFFESYFWADGIDVMVLASQYLIPVRKTMPSFKLKRVAKQLGIKVDEERLHDSMYDIELTREIYQIVTDSLF